ncbi:MAG: hypothetical protein EOP47_18880 [Sphingobacteriaceae bacterium]|nr:MAG: hypothetical protein EOP47_18880 [Sphingobacteriaceae bacterium]
MSTASAKDIDEYISGFPKDVQERLQLVRDTIKKAAPDAKEAIKYAIPTFTLTGNLLSFAGYKNHIGLYPIPAGDEAFEKEIEIYKASKSTLRFLHTEAIPVALITKVAQLRVKQFAEKALQKKK